MKASEPIDKQIEMRLARLELMLENRDASLDDAMTVEIQLGDTDAGAAVDRAYESRFDDVAFPPRTVVGVRSLPGGADVQATERAAALVDALDRTRRVSDRAFLDRRGADPRGC